MAKSKTQDRKYENPLQLGGIRTATLDDPEAGGGPGCRVALFDTGSGLRFTVALGRGGDIVHASYNDTNLAYLTPNGLMPASRGAQRDDDWLRSWAGGLLTTCGPETMGAPRVEEGVWVPQHGRHANTPAAIVSIENPDPVTGKTDMALNMVIRESRMFGPVFEIKRTIACTLGEPTIRLRDEVTNLGNTQASHNWLYHVNLGYPLLDAGARLIFRGKAAALPFTGAAIATNKLNRLKRISEPIEKHLGGGENCIFVDPPANRGGKVHVGLINAKRKIGFEMIYDKKQLPRFTNWQHLGPGGSYVTGLEPYYGSLLGKDNDTSPLANTHLRPGQKRRYELTMRVLSEKADLDALRKFDGDLKPVSSL